MAKKEILSKEQQPLVTTLDNKEIVDLLNKMLEILRKIEINTWKGH